ncbi:MAG: class I SAM-dependent methyltransferase [Chloroflexi bacterium]|nr:class I SAM-dependent methyltransferase [Chloroflexota bacterium]
MSSNPHTNRDVLLRNAYADEQAVTLRYQTHKLYSIPQIDFPSWVLDRHVWRGDEFALDAGCGPGIYFNGILSHIPNGKLVSFDLSEGMIRKACMHERAAETQLLVGDLQAIPFADATFDVVLANHVLFHVPDFDTTVKEIHRVLKPNGLVIAATNSHFSMAEFSILMRRAFSLLGHPVKEEEALFNPLQGSFSLENGAVKLARHFRAVVRHDIPGSFVFSEVQPVINYIASTRAMKEPELPGDITWDDFMTVMTDQVRRLINHFGELVVNKLSGALIATDKGGFATDYYNSFDNQPSKP